jgi:hypothetical protein
LYDAENVFELLNGRDQEFALESEIGKTSTLKKLMNLSPSIRR